MQDLKKPPTSVKAAPPSKAAQKPSNNLTVQNELTRKIDSFSAKREELHALCNKLQERAYTARDLEVEYFKSRVDAASNERDAAILRIEECFNLNVLIKGEDGTQLWGSIESVFSSANFPNHLMSLHIDSRIPMQVGFNTRAQNGFKIFLDFTKPNALDFSFLPGNATPNESSFTVDGANATWVNGVFHELNAIVSAHPASFPVVHKQSVYDVLLYLLGFPLAFWICFKFQSTLDGSSSNNMIRNALYVYLFFLCILSLRCFFHYVRWVFPRVEYIASGKRAAVHRTVIISLTLSLAGKLLYDLFRAAF